MNLLKPIIDVANVTGRARRAEYWSYVLFQILVFVALAVGFGICVIAKSSGAALVFLAVLCFLPFLLLLPMASLTVRRLHDSGRPAVLALLSLPFFLIVAGYFVLSSLLAWKGFEYIILHGDHSGYKTWIAHADKSFFFSLFRRSTFSFALKGLSFVSHGYVIWLMLKKGTTGPNKFGSDPKLVSAGVGELPVAPKNHANSMAGSSRFHRPTSAGFGRKGF